MVRSCFSMIRIASIAIMFSIFINPPAEAQLVLDPTVAQHSVAGNKIAKGSINVKNSGPDAVMVTLETECRAQFEGNTSAQADWFSAKPAKFVLAPGKSKTVKYSIKPAKGYSGEAAMVLFFTESSVLGTNNADKIMVQARNGVTVYCGIKGREVNRSEIKSISVSRGVPGGLKIDINVNNTGNVHILPRGRIFLKDNNNVLLDDIGVPAQLSILPGNSKILTVYYDKSRLAPGTYKLNAVLNCSKQASQELIHKETVFELEKL